jgi:energy-coupling factor transporter transmembrane protein EcfT
MRGRTDVDVRAVDLSATTGTSGLHRASPLTKLAAFALVLTATVAQQNAFVVLGIALLLISLVLGSRLRAGLVFSLAAYPGLFALVFAFAAAPEWLTGALFVLKAMTAALAAVTLIATTPYPQVFAPLQRVLPEIVGDALLMTYRSLFLLVEKFERLRMAVRLRSGLAGRAPLRAARAAASSLGGLVLYAFDLAEREYDVMRLRGYEGRLRVTLPRSSRPAFDAALLVAAGVVLATSFAFRGFAIALTPVSWLVPAFSLVLLTAVVAWRMIAGWSRTQRTAS